MGGTEGMRMSDIGKDTEGTPLSEMKPRQLAGLFGVFVLVAAGLTFPWWTTKLKDHATISQNRAPAMRYTDSILRQTDSLLQGVVKGGVVLNGLRTEDQGCRDDIEHACKTLGSVTYVIPHGAGGNRDQQDQAVLMASAAARKALIASGFKDKGANDTTDIYTPPHLSVVGDHSLPTEVSFHAESGDDYNREFTLGRPHVPPDALIVGEAVQITYLERGGEVAPRQPGDN